MLACQMVQAKMKKKREDKKARKGTRKGAEEKLEATISWDTEEEDKEKEEEEEEEEEGEDEEMEEDGQREEEEEDVKETTMLEQLEHCRISDPEVLANVIVCTHFTFFSPPFWLGCGRSANPGPAVIQSSSTYLSGATGGAGPGSQ